MANPISFDNPAVGPACLPNQGEDYEGTLLFYVTAAVKAAAVVVTIFVAIYVFVVIDVAVVSVVAIVFDVADFVVVIFSCL